MENRWQASRQRRAKGSSFHLSGNCFSVFYCLIIDNESQTTPATSKKDLTFGRIFFNK